MRIIGLCGGSGSGKGTVAKILSERGVAHIDADAIYHELVCGPSELMNELVCEFGDSIVNSDGGLYRPALASIVFAEGAKDKLQRLNSITHKFVIKRIEELISDFSANDVQTVLVDAPLLFESGLDRRCERVIFVGAPIDLRVKRIVARDGISDEAARKRILSQIPDDVLSRKCDYVINNDTTEAELRHRADHIADLLNI